MTARDRLHQSILVVRISRLLVRGHTNRLESLVLLEDTITFSQTRQELLASQAAVNGQDEPAVLGQLTRDVRSQGVLKVLCQSR